MKSLKITIGTTLFLSGLLIFSACHKTKETPSSTGNNSSDTEQTTAADNNLAESTISDIDAMGSEVTDNGNLSTYRTSGDASTTGISVAPCATVTGYNSNVITVDFGTSGCIGADGRRRSGKLVYTMTGSVGSTHYRNPGFGVSVSSQNYVVDSVHVTIIDKTITNTTPSSIPPTGNPGVNLTWAITASVSITKANGNTFNWGCNRVKELTNTSDPNCYHGQGQSIDWTIAVVKLNGTSTGTNAMNETYSATITNLVRDFHCSPLPSIRPYFHPFISGTIAYTPGTRPQRLVNFGTGVCDNTATLTINNQTYTLVLL